MVDKSESTIHDHIVKLDYVSFLDVWVPHNLTEKNLLGNIFICIRFLITTRRFLKQLVTGNEKWIIDKNDECKRSWRKRDELTTFNLLKNRTSSEEGNPMCLVVLERDLLL